MNKLFRFFIVSFIAAACIFADPQYYNYNNGTSFNSFPFNQAAGKRIQLYIAPGEFTTPSAAPSGNITRFSVRISTGYPLTNMTYTNFRLIFADTTLSGNTMEAGWYLHPNEDTVYYRASVGPINAAANTWLDFNLDHPHPYNNTKGLVIAIEQTAASGSSLNQFSLQHTTMPTYRRHYSVGGAPFTYSGRSLYVPNCGIDVAPTTPPYYNFNTTGGDNSFPMNQAAGKMCQWLVANGEYNQPSPALSGGSITGFYFRISGTYPLTTTTYTNFHILFGQTALTSLPPGSFYSGTMDTVYRRASVTFAAAINTWLFIPLDNPFPYNPGQSLVIQVGQCGAVGATTNAFSLTHTTLTGNRRIYSAGGCPFAYGGIGTNVVNNGILIRYPVGANNNNNQIPNAYKLEQNYPNPFNPVTTINFAMPKSSNVKLTVYDILGREVEVLVNEFRGPGNYSVNFDATNYASGVYLYKLETEGFVDAKKMQLIK